MGRLSLAILSVCLLGCTTTPLTPEQAAQRNLMLYNALQGINADISAYNQAPQPYSVPPINTYGMSQESFQSLHNMMQPMPPGYGAISEVTGRPKTEWVNPYYRADGTYVNGYWRSPSL